jgi:YebC/PmpR family DNA-binding regulatory protein
MSGHSHWSGIKHKKAINDAKKGKVFSRLAKLIYSAVKEGGGGNPADNPRLRLVLEKCRQSNMPKDNVKRAIEKATSGSEGYESVSIEGYGQGGAAVIAECLTDNTNRTVPEVKKIFEKCGAKIGTPGCVSYMFQRKGVFQIEKGKAEEERLMELALEAGAEDVSDEGDFFEIITDPFEFTTVGEMLEKENIESSMAELQLVPDNFVEVDAEVARKLMKLIEAIEEHEDVQNVYSNFDISEEVAQLLEAE